MRLAVTNLGWNYTLCNDGLQVICDDLYLLVEFFNKLKKRKNHYYINKRPGDGEDSIVNINL